LGPFDSGSFIASLENSYAIVLSLVQALIRKKIPAYAGFIPGRLSVGFIKILGELRAVYLPCAYRLPQVSFQLGHTIK